MNKTKTSRLWSAFLCTGLLFGVVHTAISVDSGVIQIPLEYAEVLLDALENAIALRAPRPGVDPSNPAYPVATCNSTELALIAGCVCAIKNQLIECCSEIESLITTITAVSFPVAVTSQLDSCCSVIEDIDSKVDILLTKTVSCDLTVIESQLDSLNSMVDSLITSSTNSITVVVSQLDSCCSIIEDISSMVDIIDQTIVPCCSVVDDIDSKVDILLTMTFACDLTVIESQLDSCCSVIETISSMVDSLITSSTNSITVVVSQLDSCCSIIEDISSMVDIIDQTIVPCCSVVDDIDSKVDILLTMTFACDLTVIESQLEQCCSTIEATIGSLADGGSCFPVIATQAGIDAANLDVIQWLKTLMFELRGVC